MSGRSVRLGWEFSRLVSDRDVGGSCSRWPVATSDSVRLVAGIEAACSGARRAFSCALDLAGCRLADRSGRSTVRRRSRIGYWQDAPSATERGLASPAHWIWHVESAAHDSEHEPVQCRVHVEPVSQLMLPLGPTVTSHSEPPLQLTLHDWPHVPVQSLLFAQLSVQLPPLQPESPMSHALSAGHVHEVPVHSGGGGPSLPQAAVTATANSSAKRRMVI